MGCWYVAGIRRLWTSDRGVDFLWGRMASSGRLLIGQPGAGRLPEKHLHGLRLSASILFKILIRNHNDTLQTTASEIPVLVIIRSRAPMGCLLFDSALLVGIPGPGRRAQLLSGHGGRTNEIGGEGGVAILGRPQSEWQLPGPPIIHSRSTLRPSVYDHCPQRGRTVQFHLTYR